MAEAIKKEKPLTREDVLKRIEENGGRAEGLDLSGKTFKEGINLNRLNLTKIILNGATFPIKIESPDSDWRAFGIGAQLKEVNLSGAQLQNAELALANLERSVLRGAKLQKTHLLLANLRGASMVTAELQGAYLSEANLQGADLTKAMLAGISLHRAKFSSDTRLEDVDWGDYILDEEKNGLFEWAVDTYRQLKTWYTQCGYSATAAKFYYREKEAERKSLKIFSKNWNHRLALQLSYIVFGHGEGWKRLLFGWVAGVIFLFAVAYYFWGSFNTDCFWDILYYSATSFSALGYGSWAPQPTGWAKGMGAAEAIIGGFMMALLLVTLVRKWTR